MSNTKIKKHNFEKLPISFKVNRENKSILYFFELIFVSKKLRSYDDYNNRNHIRKISQRQ